MEVIVIRRQGKADLIGLSQTVIGEGDLAVVDIPGLHGRKVDCRRLRRDDRRIDIGLKGDIERNVVLVLNGGGDHLPIDIDEGILKRNVLAGVGSGSNPNAATGAIVAGRGGTVLVMAGGDVGKVGLAVGIGGERVVQAGNIVVLQRDGGTGQAGNSVALVVLRSGINVGGSEADTARSRFADNHANDGILIRLVRGGGAHDKGIIAQLLVPGRRDVDRYGYAFTDFDLIQSGRNSQGNPGGCWGKVVRVENLEGNGVGRCQAQIIQGQVDNHVLPGIHPGCRRRGGPVKHGYRIVESVVDADQLPVGVAVAAQTKEHGAGFRDGAVPGNRDGDRRRSFLGEGGNRSTGVDIDARGELVAGLVSGKIGETHVGGSGAFPGLDGKVDRLRIVLGRGEVDQGRTHANPLDGEGLLDGPVRHLRIDRPGGVEAAESSRRGREGRGEMAIRVRGQGIGQFESVIADVKDDGLVRSEGLRRPESRLAGDGDGLVPGRYVGRDAGHLGDVIAIHHRHGLTGSQAGKDDLIGAAFIEIDMIDLHLHVDAFRYAGGNIDQLSRRGHSRARRHLKDRMAVRQIDDIRPALLGPQTQFHRRGGINRPGGIHQFNANIR